MEISKKLLRELLWSLHRASTRCEDMHHGKFERHDRFREVCPVEMRIDKAIRAAEFLLDAPPGLRAVEEG